MKYNFFLSSFSTRKIKSLVAICAAAGSVIALAGDTAERKHPLMSLQKSTVFPASQSQGKLFTAKNAVEATMTYTGQEVSFEPVINEKPITEAAIMRNGGDNKIVRSKIETQYNHLFGPMSEAEIKAVPAGQTGSENITNISFVKKTGSTYTFKYDYKGKILVFETVPSSYEITLPINVDTIFEAGCLRSNSRTECGERGNINYCTDSHYQSEGDFWYFWTPDRQKNPRCPLEEGVHYVKRTAQVKKIANSVNSAPEYKNLPNSENGVITVSVFFGMDDADHNPNPLEVGGSGGRDINAGNYQGFIRQLQGSGRAGLGFKLVEGEWSDSKTASFLKKLGAKNPPAKRNGKPQYPFVQEFEKVYPNHPVQLKNGTEVPLKVLVRTFFGPTGMGERYNGSAESEEDAVMPFHYFFKNALEKSSVVMYDGHSGLGGHLDLESIEQTRGFSIELPKDRYQIYYFNSCTSYTYYNRMYFSRKITEQDAVGSKKLDIMTNGLATLFSVMVPTSKTLVNAIDLWAEKKGAMSYKAIADIIDSNNLFGINGDEDNDPSAKNY